MPPSSSTGTLQRRNRTSVPGRMGMRKWLEHLLDNRQCEGLEWENKPMKTFSIVWKHASSHGFDHSKHADVFIQWARYKGRTAVKEERNQKKKKGDNYDSKYKSNFRCALHSLIDCIEIPSEEDSPKKFFQFISPSHPQYKERREKKRNSYNKKAQKRTHDGKFSEGQKTMHIIDLVKDELKEGCDSNENNVLTLQEKKFGHHVEETNGNTFSEKQKTAQTMDVQKDELEASCESNQNDMTNQETKFGTALGSQNAMETLQENLQHLPGQTLTFHEMGNAAVPFITLQSKETTGKVEIIYGETTQEPSSSLPNFEALGMKVQYGPKIYRTSTLLASGGDMQVMKVPEERTEFTEPITVKPPQLDDIKSFNTMEVFQPNNVNPVNNVELPQTNDINPINTVELPQTNNGNSVMLEFVLADTNQDEENFVLDLQENSQMNLSNNMYLSQDQEPFSNMFLSYQDDDSVNTSTSNNLNNDGQQYPGNLEFDFSSDSDLPYYGPF